MGVRSCESQKTAVDSSPDTENDYYNYY